MYNSERFLPRNIKPIHYEIIIEPDIESRSFDGNVTIDIDLLHKSTSIIANAHPEIDIKSTKLSKDGRIVPGVTLHRDQKAQRYPLSVDDELEPGRIQIHHGYTGHLNSEFEGFYRTPYRDENGNDAYLASTQGQPTGARRMFPCFDEPHFKATFSVTLVIDPAQQCVNNMPVASTKDVGSKKHVSFEKTPPMSPYLVCFIVGKGFHQTKNDAHKFPITIYTASEEDAKNATFSLELAVRTMNFFEKQFQAEYPLPKLDFASFPNFFPGAMENWGLITFKRDVLLLDEEFDSFEKKRLVVEVAVHEMSHQWFGNLVTTATWDGTWLNEGFATWVSLFALNHFYPEWKVWDEYVENDRERGLALDSLRNSHPVELEIEPGQEGEALDEISYQKGSAILRMISAYVSEAKFLAGVAAYIKKFAYSSTSTSDLWDSLTEYAQVNMREVMNPWVVQTGFPMVTVDEVSPGKIRFTQHRFLRTNDVESDEDHIWPIALNVVTKNGPIDVPLFTTREIELSVPSSFYRINSSYTGFYRTLYSSGRFEILREASADGLLNISDRAGLLSDIGAFAIAGHVKTSVLLKWLHTLKRDSSAVVWTVLLAQLNAVRRAWIFKDERTKAKLKSFQRDLVEDMLDKNGWDFGKGEEPLEQKLRAALFSAAVEARMPKAVQAARDMFAKFRSGDKDAINANLRYSVFAIALEEGVNDEFDFLLKEYVDNSQSSYQDDIRVTLGRTAGEENRTRLLDLLLDKDKVPSIDIYKVASGFTHRAEALEMLWSWTKANWDNVIARMPVGPAMRSVFIKICTVGLVTRKLYEDIQNFFEIKKVKGDYPQAVGQVLDTVRASLQWVERDNDDLVNCLDEYVGI